MKNRDNTSTFTTLQQSFKSIIIHSVQNLLTHGNNILPQLNSFLFIYIPISYSYKLFSILYQNGFRLADSLLFLNSLKPKLSQSSYFTNTSFKYSLFLNTKKTGYDLRHQSSSDVDASSPDIEQFLINVLLQVVASKDHFVEVSSSSWETETTDTKLLNNIFTKLKAFLLVRYVPTTQNISKTFLLVSYPLNTHI
eukprot:snap_masked-scaffold_58-processed-gene-0.42-mRNA-1 protein AED:1.00 eAED:1.00 QI:0/0/0/0/1/1/2/0/194